MLRGASFSNPTQLHARVKEVAWVMQHRLTPMPRMLARMRATGPRPGSYPFINVPLSSDKADDKTNSSGAAPSAQQLQKPDRVALKADIERASALIDELLREVLREMFAEEATAYVTEEEPEEIEEEVGCSAMCGWGKKWVAEVNELDRGGW